MIVAAPFSKVNLLTKEISKFFTSSDFWFVFTDISRDGMLTGINVEKISKFKVTVIHI